LSLFALGRSHMGLPEIALSTSELYWQLKSNCDVRNPFGVPAVPFPAYNRTNL